MRNRLNIDLRHIGLGALLIAAVTATPASAQSGSDWEFRLTPYLFATGLKGDVGFGELPPAEVEATFSDILDNLDFALMLYGEARKGRWGFWGDGIYVKLGVEPENPFPIALIYSGVAIDVTLKSISAGGSYALVDSDRGHLDLVAGARYWNVDQDLTFIGFTQGVPDRTVSAGDSWTDPVIGLRGRTALSDRWRLNGQLISAVGGDSESSIDAMLNIGYAFNDLFTLGLGYRYLNVDFESDSFLFDVEFKGPLIGAAFSW